jgi:hypothetical protein
MNEIIKDVDMPWENSHPHNKNATEKQRSTSKSYYVKRKIIAGIVIYLPMIIATLLGEAIISGGAAIVGGIGFPLTIVLLSTLLEKNSSKERGNNENWPFIVLFSLFYPISLAVLFLDKEGFNFIKTKNGNVYEFLKDKEDNSPNLYKLNRFHSWIVDRLYLYRSPWQQEELNFAKKVRELAERDEEIKEQLQLEETITEDGLEMGEPPDSSEVCTTERDFLELSNSLELKKVKEKLKNE